MSEWIKCSDRMPEIDFSKSEYSWYVNALVTDGKCVTYMTYISNGYAKTEKGKKPRWEYFDRIAHFEPTHWMPLPPPPKA